MKLPSLVKIPSLVLQRLYTVGSLENHPGGGIAFQLKNRLSDARLTRVRSIQLCGRELPLDRLRIEAGGGAFTAAGVSPETPLEFPLGAIVTLVALDQEPLAKGKHEIAFDVESEPFGHLAFKVKDAIAEPNQRVVVPYDKEHNQDREVIRKRQKFGEEVTGTKLHHLAHYSFDPHTTEGNVENFTGVAQVPIGFAGPLHVDGEHARGDFVIPLATTEGTLVASYNRGMKVLNLSGGVTSTVQDDCMQRAPVFIFDSARGARDFRFWVDENLEGIREAAESTSSVARLLGTGRGRPTYTAADAVAFLLGDRAA